MSGDGDSSGDELTIERVNSQKVTPTYNVVPNNVKYTFKFKNRSGKAYSLMEYILNEGKRLPYITVIKGWYFLFV